MAWLAWMCSLQLRLENVYNFSAVIWYDSHYMFGFIGSESFVECIFSSSHLRRQQSFALIKWIKWIKWMERDDMDCWIWRPPGQSSSTSSSRHLILIGFHRSISFDFGDVTAGFVINHHSSKAFNQLIKHFVLTIHADRNSFAARIE